MADKKKSGVSVVPEFVDGEQPTADKFNTIGSQLKRAAYVLEKAVGDAWDESYPYSEESSTRLTLPWGRRLDGAGIIGEVSGADSLGRRLDIANISRLIGPASNLNPTALTEGFIDDVSDIYVSEIEDESPLDASAQDIYEFYLRYPPILNHATHPDPIFSAATADVFTLRKTDPDDLTAQGDYHVSEEGKVTLYGWQQNGATGDLTVTYWTSPSMWGGGPNYPGAAFNVIPDPNQTGDGCIVQDAGDGTYLITLPSCTDQQSNYAGSSAALEKAVDINFNAQLKLPPIIRAICGGDVDTPDDGTPGVVIPEGVVYLRENETGLLFTDAVYYYLDDDSLQIGNVELEDSDGADGLYSIVTIGTDITSSIDDLRKKGFQHSHDRSYGEAPVHIKDIAGRTETGAVTIGGNYRGPFLDTGYESNWFPQYYHRIGFMDNAPAASNQNAMIGNVVIGVADTYADDADEVRNGYYTYQSNALNYTDDNRSTYYLRFGSNDNEDGPQIRSTGNRTLDIRSANTATTGGSADIDMWGRNDIHIYAGTASETGTPIGHGTSSFFAYAMSKVSITTSGHEDAVSGGIWISDNNKGIDIRTNVTSVDNLNISHFTPTSQGYHPLAIDGHDQAVTIKSRGDTYGNIDLDTDGSGTTGYGSSVRIFPVGGFICRTAWGSQTTEDQLINTKVRFTAPESGSGSPNDGDFGSEDCFFHVSGYQRSESAFLAVIEQKNNDNTDFNGDILKLEAGWTSSGGPSRWREWLKFYRRSDKVKGGVRQTIDNNLGYGLNAGFREVTARIDSSPDRSSAVDNTDAYDFGDVCYYSGDQDFGEWIEMGDIDEWFPDWVYNQSDEFKALPETEQKAQYYEFVADRCEPKGTRMLGITEGTTVWVRGGCAHGNDGCNGEAKFYRTSDGGGVAMIVSHRAFLVGNEPKKFADGEIGVGEILSFCGQVPVKTFGACNVGDLLVPIENGVGDPGDGGAGYCRAVSPDEISLKDYIKSVGSALCECEDSGLAYHKVLTAIGVK